MTELEDKVRTEVEKIIDPETGMTFGQMKMITKVKEKSPGVVRIEYLPTSPFCPIAFKFSMDIKNAAEKVAGVEKALVYVHGHTMEKTINEMVNKEEPAK
ncbi:MAG: iron-sulfur cluster assembly protein [Candidatus Bathyarchaeia archaeon]